MPEPIVRHYRGASRAAAEEVYRQDANQAFGAGYVPVAHRWGEDWSGHTLSVAYQLQSALQQPAAPPLPPVQPTPAAVAPQPAAAPAPATSSRPRLSVQTLDLHCAGEPLRMIRSGYPAVPHLPVLERRAWARDNADHIRRLVVHEPRGHRDMYAAVLLPPYSSDADVCLLFMHNEGYSTMCGHGVIAVTVGLLEEGLYPTGEPVTTIRYEVAAGHLTASASTVRQPDGSVLVEGVRFTNVPAYLHARSLAVGLDGVQLHGSAAERGGLEVDLAFGGAYYGIVDAAELGLRVVPEQADALRRAGAAITDVLRREHTPTHPTDTDLGFVYGTIIVDREPATSPDGRAREAHLRNATIFADAELDRSPCGSGTSALLAQLHARGDLQVGQEIVNAGITGEHFLGRLEAETTLGDKPAVVTSIAGTAYITGRATLVVDERDPLGEGFVLG
ncbi:MAG TPA: proline racemase family protein [Candidatus Limnocylindria bacterium]|nr:proline racemase family protein [Candidatus Limnocylindria bacterium]